ncbi:MAG: glycosyltransferase family 2 protein [Fimbriimonadaceae bacterium]|nr:glycosyltransferase family 2 protein [Fimbriimonadaceae bacterium]
MKITAIVPTYNEAANIEECLRGLQWADEVLVVDSYSTDGTPGLAAPLATRVVRHAYEHSAAQKNWAIPQASHEWIFLMDADERCPPELAVEIESVLAAEPKFDAYWIRRRNYFLGKEMRHGGWAKDKVIRLFRRELRYQDLPVHADIDVPFERVGTLRERLVHFSIDSLDQFFEKRMRYAAWAARELDREGKRGSTFLILARGSLHFLKMYVLRGGFLDGKHGFVLAFLYSFYTSAKYVRLWERQLPPHPRHGVRNQGAVRPMEARESGPQEG